MLSILPPELVLSSIKYLHISQLHQLQLLSKEWNNFVATHESSIYRAAAIVHNFVSPNSSLTDAKNLHPVSWLGTVRDWKDLCQRWFQLERSWEGRNAPPNEGALENTETDALRFQVDEKYRFVITTHVRGGLLVTSMDDDTTLFRISKNYVRLQSHCEYDNGFLIFDHADLRNLEVWRLETDDWDLSIPSGPPGRHLPNESQRVASRYQTLRSTVRRRPCNFSPWAFLTPPRDLRAYRFVYPTLLVGSEHGQELYLFDIPSATLTQTIPLSSHPSTQSSEEFGINYVELGARHAFVCTGRGLFIVSRDSSEGTRMITELPSPEMGLRSPELARYTSAQMGRHTMFPQNSSMIQIKLDPPQEPASNSLVRLNEASQIFTAVHVSPSGKDFAATNWHGILFLVRDFERVERGEATFADVTLRINLRAPAMHLAFEHGRVAVQTTIGVYIINLDADHHAVLNLQSGPSVESTLPVWPHLTMYQLMHFTKTNLLASVDCLQMTKTGLWIIWSAFAIEQSKRERFGDDVVSDSYWRYGLRAVCYVDFGEPKACRHRIHQGQ